MSFTLLFLKLRTRKSNNYCQPLVTKLLTIWGIIKERIEQKGMTFEHHFSYSLPLFYSLLKKDRRRKGELIPKIVIKSHAFLLDHRIILHVGCTQNILVDCTFLLSYTPRNSQRNKECHHTVRNKSYLNSFIKLRLRFWL